MGTSVKPWRKDERLALEAYTLAAAVWPQYVDALIAVGDLHARAAGADTRPPLSSS
jgi:hypothetical protein